MTDLTELTYEAVMELKADVGRIGEAVRNVSSKLDGHIKDDAEVEQRVGSLERKVSRAHGAFVVIGAIAGIAGNYVLSLFQGKHP